MPKQFGLMDSQRPRRLTVLNWLPPLPLDL
jgi:hypothetical protein